METASFGEVDGGSSIPQSRGRQAAHPRVLCQTFGWLKLS